MEINSIADVFDHMNKVIDKEMKKTEDKKTNFQLELISDDPYFDTFKDQLKAYLSNAYYGIDFSSEDNAGACLRDILNDKDIAQLTDDLFGQSEEIFTGMLGAIWFKGNGLCPECGTNCLTVAGEKDYQSFPERDPGFYQCIMDHFFEI